MRFHHGLNVFSLFTRFEAMMCLSDKNVYSKTRFFADSITQVFIYCTEHDATTFHVESRKGN